MLRWSLGVLSVLVLATIVPAQSLEERLDEDRFLQGLTDRGLAAVLEHYIETHPTADSAAVAGYQIAMQRMAIAEAALEPTARREAIETLLAIRATLIAGQRDHPDRVLWLADQAADLHFLVLPEDASGITSIFGLPSPAQRERAARVGAEMTALAAEAEVAVDRAILRLEATPGYGDSVALQQQRRRLADEQRDRRIPFLRGVGAVLDAELNQRDASARRAMYEVAADSLEPLLGRLDGSLADRARLFAGVALARLGDSAAAADRLESIVAAGAARPEEGCLAGLALAEIDAEREGTEAGLVRVSEIERALPEDANPLYRLLVADRKFLLLRDAARAAPAAERAERLARAFGVYIGLLGAGGTDASGAMRDAVFARLVTAAEDDAPLETLPALVTVARADHLAREAATRAEGIALFDAVLRRDDVDDRDRASAIFSLARAHRATGDTIAAIDRFTELAERFPADRRAEQSIQIAAADAARLDREAPGDGAARTRLRRALDVLLRRYPNLKSVDRWRFLAGRLALQEGRFDDARSELSRVPRVAEQWADSRFLIVNAWRVQLLEALPADRAAVAGELRRAVAEMRPTLARELERHGDVARAAELRYYIASIRVFDAEAQLALDRPEAAIEALRGIEDDRALDGVVVSAALSTRIDAYKAMNRGAEARAEVRRFIETAPEQVDDVIAPLLASLMKEVRALESTSRPVEARDLARDEAAPLAALLEAWAGSAPASPRERTGLLRQIADAYRYAERYGEALPVYDRLLATEPSAYSLLLGRAECLHGLGGESLAPAMTIYKRLGALGAERGAEGYWLAQLRMLQILDRVDRNTQRIAPHIERLRAQDPNLGGDRFRRAFDALQAKYR